MDGNLDLSLVHLERAWEDVRALDDSILDEDSYRKVTAVAIYYAEVLEMQNRLIDSSRVIAEAYEFLVQRQSSLSRSDKWRKFELSVKMGDLAERSNKPKEARVWREKALDILKEDFGQIEDNKLDLLLSDIFDVRKEHGRPLETIAWYCCAERQFP
ncbi:hypothetical protein SISNIDRAFT_450946 [Sistotremastrum niveocremeum HHB9708]|uniref:Uncharacterized protein n=1 Tax=Sistotremastrum niveocremeum HHB9708 TaxID=1314777 RepID=A0A164XTX3_9AGAM|nr:hypothetical protein SISNIDRAFT_450946 [Sistotremastrum niveocremeum HHB9708]